MVISSKPNTQNNMNGNSNHNEKEEDDANKTSNGHNNDNANPSLPNKKAKTTSLLKEILNPHVYTPEREKILAADYAKSLPYHHSRIENLFDVAFLNRVKDEIKQNSKVNFKETDLFRVYQSIDLANLSAEISELAHNMPSVMKLRQVLYSTEWRTFMERVTNLPPNTLSAQVDCACNCHAPGCHLLCHDDVIGTRKISYILYLTEPDWNVEEGGALELYDSHQAVQEENNSGDSNSDKDAKLRREPNTIPALNVMPTFNSMAFFIVEPGVSFHAVQEVLGDRPRLSIQGWYHAAHLPEHMEHATLSRLKEKLPSSISTDDNSKTTQTQTQAPKDNDAYIPWKDDRIQPLEQRRQQRAANADKLSDADRDYLASFVNETYLTKTAMEEIRQRFEEDSSVQLKHFFRTSWMEPVKATITEQDNPTTRPKVGQDGYYEWGVSDEWKLIGPSHKQRYLQYQETQDYTVKVNKKGNNANYCCGTHVQPPKENKNNAGDLLSRLKQSVMQSPAFGRYLNYITSLGVPLGFKGQIRRFRPGLDYTVAHYGVLTHSAVLDATVCFAAGTGGVGPVPVEDQEEGKQTNNNNNNNGGVDGDEEDDDDLENMDEADILWQSDDVGGFECYIEADDYESSFKDGEGNMDEDNNETNGDSSAKVAKAPEAADEYNEDDDTNLLSVSASNNTLSLVYRDPGTMRFIKYVGSRAPSSRWDISMEYRVPEDHENDASSKTK